MTPFLQSAIEAARLAGDLLRENFGQQLKVNAMEAHDIKLDLDVLSQNLITGKLLSDFPEHALYGEEGIAGNEQSPFQWIVDPIDGTVNYYYAIPHFCVSIALRKEQEILLGVIYDPMRDELWSVETGGVTQLNGKPCSVSQRTKISDSILSVGFAKSQSSIEAGLPVFERMVQKARKCRMLGSAALDMAYIASGRLDAYIEQTISLWDIAAGKILVEAAGGKVDLKPRTDLPDKFSIVASSGRIDLNI